MCTLLTREVLTGADEESGTVEVQYLRFALPAGARASGPTAHVKVRAPDAPGQTNRVRAYSMRLEGAQDSDAGIDAPRESGAGERSARAAPAIFVPGSCNSLVTTRSLGRTRESTRGHQGPPRKSR